MAFAYVIEHMEDDEQTPTAVPPWVFLEYAHMRTLAGPGSHIHFTSLSKPSSISLSDQFRPQAESEDSQLANVQCHQQGILDLMRSQNVSLDQVCLLDPKAEQILSPLDGDGKFSWFLFGGILGDDPPRDRTSELRVLGFPTRNLGSIQMTTDTALGVTKLVVQDKIPLDKIPYVDFPTIRFNAKESVEMPFRYIVDKNGDPALPPGMRQLLHEDLNKSFDF
ncbi:hypothetical protein AGABI1DRAFT_121406 [Agaricus bisporus var. burnettii JB137-S8]|uniref:DUF431-domain-containing protein n=2 Tax=Agaricus bisporus var. burnettii TaxID=192524 RepID=K5VUW7_AGABU|nr:uncharacterized protein AGABI1DRAFT_121406 [Agaricus bisporus var. burnettii JB137-S8]EKM78279.1 hypothetical protein AGABI1DRAFT_121406 [Agaricus bisporus var. burnettii JB137-S8]KAF7762082.1 hypothetical protein Agabi119p4_8675 [Agaricus bisporus var. burnettii]